MHQLPVKIMRALAHIMRGCMYAHFHFCMKTGQVCTEDPEILEQKYMESPIKGITEEEEKKRGMSLQLANELNLLGLPYPTYNFFFLLKLRHVLLVRSVSVKMWKMRKPALV